MPRFKNAEEKKQFILSKKKALIRLFVDRNIKDKNERDRIAEEKFNEYVDKMSADTSREKDREDVQEAYKAFQENGKIAQKYKTNKSEADMWGRLAQGLIRPDNSPESKRFNITFEESSATREGQVKIVKYAAKELLQLDMSKWPDFIDGSAVPDRDDMRKVMLGFIVSNVIDCIEQLNDDEMPKAQREAVIEILSARKGFYELGSDYRNAVNGKNTDMYQVMPKVKHLTPEETAIAQDVCSRNPQFAVEAAAFMRVASDDPTIGSEAEARNVRKGLDLLKNKKGFENIDLLKPEGKYYLVRDAVYAKDDVAHHKSAVELMVNAAQKGDIDGVLKIEKMDQDKIDLVEDFIKAVNNDPPSISDERYEELLKLEEAREEKLRQDEEKKRLEEQAYSTAQRELKSLSNQIPAGLGKKDEAFKEFKEKLVSAHKDAQKYAEEMAASALSVIWENRNCSGNRERRQKLTMALEALNIVKPKLAKALAQKENKHLKASEQVTLKIRDEESTGRLEKADYDYKRAERNDYRMSELTQMMDFMDSHLDPWYHRNSQSYKDLKREINTCVRLSRQEPMSESCVIELYKRVREAGEAYVRKHEGASGELGKNRLRAVRGCLYICEHMVMNDDKELLNRIRDEENIPADSRKDLIQDELINTSADQPDVKLQDQPKENIVKVFGVRMHKTREALIHEMTDMIRSTGDEYTKQAEGGNSKTVIRTAASYVSQFYLMKQLSSKVLDLKDYDSLVRRDAFTRLKQELEEDADFRKIASELVPNRNGLPDISGKCEENRKAFDRADAIWSGISRELDIEAFRNMEANRKKPENPGLGI